MKVFLLAVLAIVLISVAADQTLNGSFQMTSPQAYTTEGVRLSGPGDNLVQF